MSSSQDNQVRLTEQYQDIVYSILGHVEHIGLIYFRAEYVTLEGESKIKYGLLAEMIKQPNGFLALRKYFNNVVTKEARKEFIRLEPALELFFI